MAHHQGKIMNRYEQRKRKFLQDAEVRDGYQEMGAELQLMQALETIRDQQQISKEALAEQMGKKREAVSRLLTGENTNPTLSTIVELLRGLGLTAEIRLRQSEEGESPVTIEIAMPGKKA